MRRKLAFLSEATQFGLLLRSKRKDQKGRVRRKLAFLSEATQFGLLLRSKRTLNEFCFQGVAQLVARSVRDAEVVGSSPITLTIFLFQKNLMSWEPKRPKGQTIQVRSP